MAVPFPRTVVVSPTLNEAQNVESHAHRVFSALPNASLLIVDDDSPDRTWELAGRMSERSPGLHVLRRERDHGFGRSYSDGFRWAIERGFQRVVMMDADGSHPAEALPRLLQESSRADFVVGSRYGRGGSVLDWNRARRLLSFSANLYAAFWTGVACKDLTGGYNCIDVELLKKLPPLLSDGYAFQIELKFLARRAGAVLAEIPIQFSGRTLGKSKLSRKHILEGLWRPPALRLGRRDPG
ncbi:MAG: polyprenol monophosphomannose synthase [Thermoanaerobaculia bacterium]